MSLTPVYFVYSPFTPPAGDIVPGLTTARLHDLKTRWILDSSWIARVIIRVELYTN
jgi:hypothetical protein